LRGCWGSARKGVLRARSVEKEQSAKGTSKADIPNSMVRTRNKAKAAEVLKTPWSHA
jgi:hypothetical protein